MKELGAIAALRNLVAFNTEVADELRAVFDDFTSTEYGQSFSVAPIENFQTDQLGQSTFMMYNKDGHPEFALAAEIQSNGELEISMLSKGKETSERCATVHLGFEHDTSPDLAAAKVIGTILDLDQSSRFGNLFRDYVQTQLTGNAPSIEVSREFPGPARG